MMGKEEFISKYRVVESEISNILYSRVGQDGEFDPFDLTILYSAMNQATALLRQLILNKGMDLNGIELLDKNLQDMADERIGDAISVAREKAKRRLLGT